jgi:hypothetical protein
MWRRPAVVLGYFLTFLVLEWVAEAFFLPPGTLGPEVAMLCLPLALVFGGAIVWARRLEASAGPEEGGAPR